VWLVGNAKGQTGNSEVAGLTVTLCTAR